MFLVPRCRSINFLHSMSKLDCSEHILISHIPRTTDFNLLPDIVWTVCVLIATFGCWNLLFTCGSHEWLTAPMVFMLIFLPLGTYLMTLTLNMQIIATILAKSERLRIAFALCSRFFAWGFLPYPTTFLQWTYIIGRLLATLHLFLMGFIYICICIYIYVCVCVLISKLIKINKLNSRDFANQISTLFY